MSKKMYTIKKYLLSLYNVLNAGFHILKKIKILKMHVDKNNIKYYYS